MHLPFHKRTLLRAWLASVVLLAAASACSRSDKARTDASQEQTGTAGTVDTLMVADSQPNVAPAPADTQAAPRDSAVSSGDTTVRQPVARSTTGRTQPAAAAPTSDSSISGYQAMTGDTAPAPRGTDTASADIASPEPADRVRPPEDSTETLGAVTTNDSVAVSDDTATSSTEMVRDTSTSLAQADTSVEVEVDTTTAVADSATQVAADTSPAIQAQVDTTSMDQQAEVAVEAPADTANVDTLADETGRVRPPEDSTEVYGSVTEDQQKHEDVDAASDQTPAAGAGVQTSGETITGAAAVAQTTREGQRCSVVEGEESEQDIRWDLASSPATMNPCGTGTMTLPRIQMEEQR